MAQDGIPNGNGNGRSPSSTARRAASHTVVSGQVVGVAKLLEGFGLDPLQAYVCALGYGAVMGAAGKVARDALHEHETGVVRMDAFGLFLANLFAALG